MKITERIFLLNMKPVLEHLRIVVLWLFLHLFTELRLKIPKINGHLKILEIHMRKSFIRQELFCEKKYMLICTKVNVTKGKII